MKCPRCGNPLLSPAERVTCSCGEVLVKRRRAFGKILYVWEPDKTRQKLEEWQRNPEKPFKLVRGHNLTGNLDRGQMFDGILTVCSGPITVHYRNIEEILNDNWRIP